MIHNRNSSASKRNFVFLCIGVIIYILWSCGTDESQINISDALFLSKNSFKELKEMYLSSKKHKDLQLQYTQDVDYPLNNMVNSIFPIDTKFEFNVSGSDWEFAGRYASFSPILNFPLTGHYRILPTDACKSIVADEFIDYKDSILIVLRGGCTFVQKVSNIVDSDLNPKAIVISNNEPLRGLITMYSSTFNDDRSLMSPVLFITNESYQIFVKFELEDPLIRLTTSSLGNWVNIMISMMLSPPLMIILTYFLIKFILKFRKLRNNKNGKKLVENLPVFIYNKNHLIHHKRFYDYLNTTKQMNEFVNTNDDSDLSSSSLDFEDRVYYKPTPSSSDASMNNFVINGVNIKSLAGDHNILIMGKDFYPAFKCSICLEKFKPLRSRVLVLNCKHFFHEKCLSNWIINFKRSCPLCNNVVSVNVSNNSLTSGQESYNSYGSFDEEAEVGFDNSANEFQINDYIPIDEVDEIEEDDEVQSLLQDNDVQHLSSIESTNEGNSTPNLGLRYPASLQQSQTSVTSSPEQPKTIISDDFTIKSSTQSFYTAQETIESSASRPSIPITVTSTSSIPSTSARSSRSSTTSSQSTILQM